MKAMAASTLTIAAPTNSPFVAADECRACTIGIVVPWPANGMGAVDARINIG
ncbi:MAG: hypothetical protein K2Y35_12450 [Burkholderiales bacterium]|nr:hypothetical protein [Burkholderiales bacterium]